MTNTDMSASRRGLLTAGIGIAAVSATLGETAPASAASVAPSTRLISNMLTVRDGSQIYYKDWGSGPPIVFSHGWPLSADAF